MTILQESPIEISEVLARAATQEQSGRRWQAVAGGVGAATVALVGFADVIDLLPWDVIVPDSGPDWGPPVTVAKGFFTTLASLSLGIWASASPRDRWMYQRGGTVVE